MHSKYVLPLSEVTISKVKILISFLVIGVVDTLYVTSQLITMGIKEAANDINVSKIFKNAEPITEGMEGFFYISSIYLTVLLTFERFIAICHQDKLSWITRGKTKIYIVCIILCSLLWNIPLFLTKT